MKRKQQAWFFRLADPEQGRRNTCQGSPMTLLAANGVRFDSSSSSSNSSNSRNNKS